MQQQFDLLLFLISNAILVYWCVLTIRYKGEKTLLLRLSKRHVIVLVIIEIILFFGMYLNYQIHKSTDIADSFAWHYSIIYARGVLPLAGLTYINDRIFSFKDPIFICLLVCLIIDYLVLLLCSKIAGAIKK